MSSIRQTTFVGLNSSRKKPFMPSLSDDNSGEKKWLATYHDRCMVMMEMSAGSPRSFQGSTTFVWNDLDQILLRSFGEFRSTSAWMSASASYNAKVCPGNCARIE